MDKKTVLAIGRWMPIHLGHKQFLVNLAKGFDTLVVGIGSCYENGTPRNCIPAVEREKLLHTIFKKEGITNYKIVHLPDRPTFEEWFSDVIKLCDIYCVTHFCTGNKEDILDVMREKNINMELELINPEDTSSFPYHATDIRNAILAGECERLDSMIPTEIKGAVLSQVAKEIKMVNEGKGQEFIPGRQTVDMVFVVHDKALCERYLLIGKREETKKDFAGYYAIPGGGIGEFESPVDAVLRCFEAETGIKVAVNDRSTEPAAVTICNPSKKPSEMHFTGIYSSQDESINGTLGGGSQCFAIVIEDSVENITPVLNSTHDMVELKFVPIDEVHKIDFAYDQKRMVYNALAQLGIPCDKGELIQCFDENGAPSNQPISRNKAHRDGITHGASHTFIYKRENGVLSFLLQRRSYNKDSFPGYLDTSSAGHIEFGSDFLDTAIKELCEELGLKASPEDLEELFEQKIHWESNFNSRNFIDDEINKVYALECNFDMSDISLQEEEVCEVVWMTADDILAELEKEERAICTSRREFRRVIEILRG